MYDTVAIKSKKPLTLSERQRFSPVATFTGKADATLRLAKEKAKIPCLN
jgi:hypothetical protein